MARLLFLTTLFATVVCAAGGADDKKSLSVSFSCDATCENCYDSIYAFTPGDACQEGGEDFSYKATCAAENGAWTLKTYRGKGCAQDKEVYSFGGAEDTCKAVTPAKHTNVKIASIASDNVKFSICPFKDDDKCTEADAATAGCSTETIAPGTCTKGTGDYYYTVEVKGSKASIAVFSTKAECDKKLLPLTRIIEQESGTCVSYEHHVKAVCEAESVVEEKPLTIAHNCNPLCDSCYQPAVTFTPGDACQEVGEDFSYKATCNAEGAWTLKTYRGKGCAQDKEVYSFGGAKDTCTAVTPAKHTNVKIASIADNNVKFTICPLKGDKNCIEADDTATAGCFTKEASIPQTTACEEMTFDDKKYYYTVEVKDSKASIAVFSTKAECDKKLLPLTRIIEQATGTCVSYEHHVKAVNSVCSETTTTTTEATTTEATTTETTTTEATITEATITEATTSGTTTSGTTTTDAEGENNTTSDGAGVTSLVAATVTAAALAMLF